MQEEIHLSHNTTPSQQVSSIDLANILLGRAMSLILNFLERAEGQLSENVYFYPPQTYCWLFALEGVTTT